MSCNIGSEQLGNTGNINISKNINIVFQVIDIKSKSNFKFIMKSKIFFVAFSSL